jgi:hypothetical protein
MSELEMIVNGLVPWDEHYGKLAKEQLKELNKELHRSTADQHEPDPKPGKLKVADFVLADIQSRVDAGYKKYGTFLETDNGRDPLWDLYQELIDAIFYLRQEILERDKV